MSTQGNYFYNTLAATRMHQKRGNGNSRMIPQLMNIRECSERLRIPVGTLRNWCSQKRIPYLKVNGRCLFDPREIERWLEGSMIREEDIPNYSLSYKRLKANRLDIKGRMSFARLEAKNKSPQDTENPKGRDQ